MSMQKKLKTRGTWMLVSFFILLGVIFTPVFPGNQNGLDYMDNLFNMISKGSVYFIPTSIENSEQYVGQMIDATFQVKDEEQANGTADLFRKNGAEVTVTATELTIRADMGVILKSSLEDSDYMYNNNGAPVADKYGYSERQVLYNWWTAFKGIAHDLNTQKNFKEAKAFDAIQKRAIEPAYNYYGVDSGNYKDYLLLIIAALVFYVFYTLWYGFGIMYLFEGFGMNISH